LIHTELSTYDTKRLSIEVVNAKQTIEMDDKPSQVIREKPDSSMHIGINMVKNGMADAFVTAGNTGAALGIAMLRGVGLGRIPGVKRPALGVNFPTPERPFLIDNGANADCKPEYLLQFGLMGSIYVERVLGTVNPRVALISNGEEEGKGNTLIQEAAPLLANSGLNFIGNIEPKEFMRGVADVAVADGFTGNILMKTAEAVSSYMAELIRTYMKANPITALGGLLSRSVFSQVKAHLDPDEVGGAPLLGVNGPIIIGHGRSNEVAIKHAIGQARLIVQNDVVETIAARIQGSGST
jgi:glycerol-3-phosphate acyltransferase PlsX